MKLHTSLTASQVYQAMRKAHINYSVSMHVNVADIIIRGSRSHDHAYDIQLGSNVNDDLPPGYKDRCG